MKLFFKRIWFTLTHPGWHRLDRHKPYYHQPCDVVEIKYGTQEISSSYEVSTEPNVTYEGFIGEKGLFVSTPKNTYWQHSPISLEHAETLGYMKQGSRYELPEMYFRWGG